MYQSAITKADERQLRKDMRYHPERSEVSLEQLAKVCACMAEDTEARARIQRNPEQAQYWIAPSMYVRENLDSCVQWLDAHAEELGSELNGVNGERNGKQEVLGARYEIALSKYAGDTLEADDEEPSADIWEAGIYDVGTPECYSSKEYWAEKYDEDKCAPGYGEYASYGFDPRTYSLFLGYRGESFKRYLEAKTKRLQLEALQDYEGIVRATRLKEQGLQRKSRKALPDQATLQELFNYDGETLTWRVSKGRCKAGAPAFTVDKRGYSKTTINRVKYPTAEVIRALLGEQEDVTGGIVERERKTLPSLYRARVMIEGKSYSLGEYPTKAMAHRAYKHGVRVLSGVPTSTH